MGPLPNGLYKWLINGGDPITTYKFQQIRSHIFHDSSRHGARVFDLRARRAVPVAHGSDKDDRRAVRPAGSQWIFLRDEGFFKELSGRLKFRKKK